MLSFAVALGEEDLNWIDWMLLVIDSSNLQLVDPTDGSSTPADQGDRHEVKRLVEEMIGNVKMSDHDPDDNGDVDAEAYKDAVVAYLQSQKVKVVHASIGSLIWGTD